MWTLLKEYVRPKLRDSQIGQFRRNFCANRDLSVWEAQKSVPPPHIVKERIVERYAEAFCSTILVETGTYLGDMVWAMRRHFRRIISIELSESLSAKAQKRFSRYPHIDILCGDSGKALQQVLAEVNHSCLFWLDGHYSGGTTAKAKANTPVQQELDVILNHTIEGHVILIDDARCFDGTDGYPRIDEVQQSVALRYPDYAFSVTNDVIRIHPKRQIQGAL